MVVVCSRMYGPTERIIGAAFSASDSGGWYNIFEFACKEHEVALGLRYRVLQKDEGAILCVASGAVTMKKMKSPISVAFVSSEKKILSVHELGLDDSDLPLAPRTKWVWEMPKGWFAQNQIHEGMQIDGL